MVKLMDSSNKVRVYNLCIERTFNNTCYYQEIVVPKKTKISEIYEKYSKLLGYGYDIVDIELVDEYYDFPSVFRNFDVLEELAKL